MRAGMAVAIHAKRKGGQAIENKQLREMVHFAPLMISRTYDQRSETVRFARRNESFRFAGFSASSRAKTQGSEINGSFKARAADVAPLGDSEMAPQAVGIAQNGLANGAAGCNRWAGESIRRYSVSLSSVRPGGQIKARRRRRARRGSARIGKERAVRFETFCTQPETRVDFFYFFAHNPLKSPDSDE
jgi:hypothetical protein